MQQSIVIDATHLESDHPTGVEHYTSHVVSLVSEILVGMGVRVYWIGHAHHTTAKMPKGVYWQYAPYHKGWSQLFLPSLLTHLKADAYFTPSGISPLRAPCPTAMTVHDISVYESPESYSLSQQWRLKLLDKWAARSCGALLTPSEYTKEQIINRWGISNEKIFVTPLAAEKDEVTPEPISGIDTSSPLVVFMGRIETKKNLKPVLQAMACSPQPEFQLVLAGKAGVGSRELYALLPALKEGGRRVAVPGFLNQAQRRWLYEHSSVMLVPGLYEGFGLPVLEAFMYDIPCVCSASGSLPEVGGDAVVYVSDQTSQSWRKAVDSLVGNKELRDTLRSKARKRAQQYSWQKTAEGTAQALKNFTY